MMVAMQPGLITSAANPLAKRMRSLSQRRNRQREGAYLVEGVAPVWYAVDADADVETLVIAPDLLKDSPALAMVSERERLGTPVARMSAELFTRLSERDGPSGLAAIVRGRIGDLDDLVIGSDSLFMALHEVANPGNLGTIIRTAVAMGVAGVVLVGDTTDPFAPLAVKASMGSLFAVPVVHEVRLETVFDWAEAGGAATVTTSARAPTRLAEVSLHLPMVVMFGSERSGLPAAALARGSAQVSIAMHGRVSSLNLAVAAGIVLYEVRRQLD